MTNLPLYQQDTYAHGEWPLQSQPAFDVVRAAGRVAAENEAPPTQDQPVDEPPQHDDARLRCKLRTLYIAEQGAVVSLEHGRIQVKHGGAVLISLPKQQLDSIMTFGAVHLNRSVLLQALSGQLPVMLMSQGAFFQGLLGPQNTPSAEVLQAWLQARQNPMPIAKELVSAKIHNQLTVLRRNARYHPGDEGELHRMIDNIAPLLVALKRSNTLDELRGVEGLAARYYFSALQAIVPAEWQFHGRNRQPAEDPINALLSLGYSILTHNATAFSRRRGLPLNLGFLHNADQSYPALALDTIEPFRSVIVDSTILKLVKQQKISPHDFSQNAKGCRLQPAARKAFITALEKTFQHEVQYRDQEIETDYRRIMDAQLLLLKHAVVDSSKAFTAFRVR